MNIEYAVCVGALHALGLRSRSLMQPFLTIVGMISNRLNQIRSFKRDVANMPIGTRHLIAAARKGAKASRHSDVGVERSRK